MVLIIRIKHQKRSSALSHSLEHGVQEEEKKTRVSFFFRSESDLCVANRRQRRGAESVKGNNKSSETARGERNCDERVKGVKEGKERRGKGKYNARLQVCFK